jgi:AcrR family transcriptional regulator
MPRVITSLTIADFRKRLCDVASELLAEQGMDGFNMRELAKRLRVSPMTAYRYFSDKDEILAHLRARGFARLADLLEEARARSSTAQDATAALVGVYVRFALEEQVSYRLMFDLFQPASHELPELALHQRRVRTVMTDHAALLVHQAGLAGEPEVIGQFLWSALHGAVALRLTSKLDEAAFERIVAEAVRMFANACRGPAFGRQTGWPERERSSDSGLSALSAAE